MKAADELGLTILYITFFLLITWFVLYNWDGIETVLDNKVDSRLIKY